MDDINYVKKYKRVQATLFVVVLKKYGRYSDNLEMKREACCCHLKLTKNGEADT